MHRKVLILTEAQMMALERKREKAEALGEIETEHPGYLGSQDTYYVGTIKGVGRIYQQTLLTPIAVLPLQNFTIANMLLLQLICSMIEYYLSLRNNKYRCCGY